MQSVLYSPFYCFLVAAENAFMNPMMDPRFHGMWGMPGAIDDAQWQQFYQMMQPFQQQHKQQQQQLLERSKQELLMGKQGAPFPLSAYPLYYGDKRFEQQRKVRKVICCTSAGDLPTGGNLNRAWKQGKSKGCSSRYCEAGLSGGTITFCCLQLVAIVWQAHGPNVVIYDQFFVIFERLKIRIKRTPDRKLLRQRRGLSISRCLNRRTNDLNPRVSYSPRKRVY